MMRIGAMVLVGLAMLSCAMGPRAPNVTVYKGPDRTFQQYQMDDAYCRHYAENQIRSSEEDQALTTGAKGAVIAGVIGSGLGAAIGAISGSPGLGAAVGGAAGVGTGAAVGVNRGDRAAMTLQQRYDSQFAICMHAQGNLVPGAPVR